MQPHYTIPQASGIYRITCTITKKFYIGSAVDLSKRWRQHIQKLRSNKHCNRKLQNAWNKYGEQAFVFEIIEIVLVPELLTAREQYWFSKLRPFGKHGFNISPTAGSLLGLERTPEHTDKIRHALLGKPSPMRGIPRDPKTIEKVTHTKQANALAAPHLPWERACEECGITFFNKQHARQRFCSRSCGKASQRRQIQQTCVICNTVFKRQAAKISPYCSAECSYHTKLTKNDIQAIRDAPGGYGKIKSLAERYSVSTATIDKIRRGASWNRV